MEIDFLLNFFNKLYLKDTVILTFFFFTLSYLFFHKKDGLVKNIFYYFAQFYKVFIILIPLAVLVNIFVPFNKVGSLVLSLLIAIIFFGKFFISSNLRYLFLDIKELLEGKNIFLLIKRLFIIFALSLFFSAYFNYSIFKTNTPFSWGINVDLYAHTMFINDLQNKTYTFFCQEKGCFWQTLFFGYPRGSHAFLAYLDTVLPHSFINKTDYGFILSGIFTASLLIGLVINNFYSLVFALPLVFLPSYSIMLMRDHINSALFLISLFAVYYFFIEIFVKKESVKKNLPWFLLALTSAYFIYYFSLVLAFTPLLFFIALILIKNLFIKGKFLIKYLILFLFFIAVSLFFFNNISQLTKFKDFTVKTATAVLRSSKNQHYADVTGFNLRINFKNFLGVNQFSYNYLDSLYKPNHFYQKVVYLYWLVFITNLFLGLKEHLLLFFLLINLVFFGFLDYRFGYNYLQIRYYSYLVVLFLTLLFYLKKPVLSKKMIFVYLVLVIFVVRWFDYLHLNHIAARANAAENIGLDWTLPAYAVNESQGKKNILSFHIQDFNRAFGLFLPDNFYRYYAYDRWDGRLIKDGIIYKNFLNFDERNLGVVNLNNVDLLVIEKKFDYPKNLFEIVQQNDNAVLLRKKFDFTSKTLFINKKKLSIDDILNLVEEKKYYLMKMKGNDCYIVTADKDGLKGLKNIVSNQSFFVEYLIEINNADFFDKKIYLYSCN